MWDGSIPGVPTYVHVIHEQGEERAGRIQYYVFWLVYFYRSYLVTVLP